MNSTRLLVLTLLSFLALSCAPTAEGFMATRPSTFPDHDTADSNSTATVSQVQTDGWVDTPPQQVPNANLNWLLQYLGKWVRYLDDIATTQFGVQHDITNGTHTVVTATSVEVAGAGAIQQTGSGHIQSTGSGNIRTTGTGVIVSQNAARCEEGTWAGDLVLGGYVHVSGVRDDVNNTVTETVFPTGTVTLPANYTQDGRTTARVRGSVHVTSITATPVLTVRVKFGSNAVATYTLSSAAVGDHVTFDIQYSLLANSDLQGTLLVNEVDGGVGAMTFTNNLWSSYDRTVANDVEVSVQWDTASASNNAQLRGFEVEVHKR